MEINLLKFIMQQKVFINTKMEDLKTLQEEV